MNYNEMNLGNMFEMSIRLITVGIKKYYPLLLIDLVLTAIFTVFYFINPDFYKEIFTQRFYIDLTFNKMIFLIIFYALVFLNITLSVYIYSMLFDLFSKLYLGQNWDIKTSYLFIKTKISTVFLSGLVSGILIILGLFMCLIGLLPMLTLTAFTIQIVIFENSTTFKALSRSFYMTKKGFWLLLGKLLVFLLFFIFLYIIINFFSIGQSYLQDFLIRDFRSLYTPLVLAGFISLFILQNLFSYFLITFSTAFYTLLYYNQLIKYEGFGAIQMTDNYLNNQ